jgi:hypothetical protein
MHYFLPRILDFLDAVTHIRRGSLLARRGGGMRMQERMHTPVPRRRIETTLICRQAFSRTGPHSAMPMQNKPE